MLSNILLGDTVSQIKAPPRSAVPPSGLLGQTAPVAGWCFCFSSRKIEASARPGHQSAGAFSSTPGRETESFPDETHRIISLLTPVFTY